MFVRKLQLLLAATLASGVTSCDCSPEIRAIGHTVLTIDTPTPNETILTNSTFDYHATAKNNLGIQTIELHAGGQNGVPDDLLTMCPGGPTVTNLPCDYSFNLAMHASLIFQSGLTLTAIAYTPKGIKTVVTEQVIISPIVVQIILPAITPGTTPPVADVSGQSPLEIQVMSAEPIVAVAVTFDNGTVLHQWPNAGPYNTQINWDSQVGGGLHHLTAEAKDVSGDVDSTERDIIVACAHDSDCATGERCCTTNGTCYPMVGENDDCDCEHPCQLNQGCFPGTCGATPQKCRPGCNPGSFETDTPASVCAPQMGDPAYCSQLPASQATEENDGGACAVGDNCSVVTQNCPEYPLDRTNPPGPNNPAVPQTCTPVSPNTNACYPAGAIPLWGVNCDQSCTMTPVDCAQGSLCVTTVDDQGNPIGPSECRQQCTDPGGQGGCPNSRPNCEGTYAAGMVYFSTGVCTEGPCEGDSDCAAFTATPCCNSSGVCDVPGCQ